MRARIPYALSFAAVTGALLDWHPVVLPVACLLAALIVVSFRTKRGVRLGWRIPYLWPVMLTAGDRFLHLHVLGPTGSGKSSSVLMPLIHQDVVQGHGLLVMEPKGDLAMTAYHDAIHHHRRVILFNPLAEDCPHYNPLEGDADRAAEGLAWTLNQISAGGHPYYAVTARIHLLYAVRAVKTVYGGAADIGSLLTFFRDEPLQRKIVREADDESVRQYFDDQWSRKTGQSREDRQGLLNRLELLWANPHVRRVLSAPADFTWDEMLDDSWVVLCPLSLAELGESAQALGSLLWHGLAQATYRRNPARENPPFFLYLDEFHQWVADDLSDFLALARGYHLGIVLAHQDMGQLSPTLQEAVVANARQRIILPGSAADDIRRFQEAAAPYSLTVPIRYLRQGHAMVHLTRRGRLQHPHVLNMDYVSLKDNS